jgi:F-type H+-transporting ATPase subunit epsilon
MRLLITTPDAIVADVSDVVAVRAEDESGEFGVWAHHADLVTALAVSIIGWRRKEGAQGYCAVRGGLLTVSGGQEVAVATSEAILGENMTTLEAVVRDRLRVEAEAEAAARSHAEQLRLQAIRQIIGYLRPGAGEVERLGA